MKTIHVSADREYDVLIDTSFRSAVEKYSGDRARVAIFFSEHMKESIPQFSTGDTEYFYFPIPDGEAGKSPETISAIWQELGKLNVNRQDLIIGIGIGIAIYLILNKFKKE